VKLLPLPHPLIRPRRWRTTLGAGLALLALAASAVTDPKASRLYEDALQRYEKRDTGGAIVQLKNALQIDKNLLPVHVLLGKALLADGQAAAAEAAFEEALRLGVNRTEVALPMARAMVARGKPERLFDDAKFAENGLAPDDRYQLLLVKASASADLNDTPRAMKLIEQARAADPSRADSWIAEVPIRLRARQVKEATAAADKAVALAPNSASALYIRGSVAHLQADTKTTLAYYDRALKAEPTSTEALIGRAGLLLDLGRAADAARDVAELRKTSANDPRGAFLAALLAERAGNKDEARTALINVTALLDRVPIDFYKHRQQMLMLGGLAHNGLGQPEKARPYLEAAVRMHPGSGASKLLAQIYIAASNLDPAIEVLDSYLRLHPGDREAVAMLASAHLTQGRHQRATTLIQDALKRGDAPGLRTMLGVGLVGGGKFADAAGEFEKVLRKEPGNLQAGVALSSIYLQGGRTAEAQRVIELMLKQHPGNPGVLNLLGTAKARKGDAVGARKAFQQALEKDAGFLGAQVGLVRLDIGARDFEAAEKRLRTILAKSPDHLDAVLEQARLNGLTGKPGEAQRGLEKADDLSGPNNLQPGMMLVDFHLRARRPDLAAEAVKRLTAKAPDAIPVLMTVARVAIANGDSATAASNLSRASGQAGFDAVALVQIAGMQADINQLQAAAHTLSKALSERPDLLPAQALLASVSIRQGEIAAAEQLARKIIAAKPNLGPAIRFWPMRPQRVASALRPSTAIGEPTTSKSPAQVSSACTGHSPSPTRLVRRHWQTAG
jgi:cellulose synthase operon protein C